MMKLYDECCDQLLLSDERKLYTGGLKNRSMKLRGTVAEAMLSGVQHWTQKVPKL